VTAVRIRPGPVFGAIAAPPSKSYTHRALVVGHLARRPFRVRRPLDSEDTRATASAMGQLGTVVTRGPRIWMVHRPSGRVGPAPVRVNCRESGTTLRFASALAALSSRAVRLNGSARLGDRPIDELLRALEQLGASCRHLRPHGLPIEVRGPIHGGVLSLNASRSSQFASALLLALPTLEEDSQMELAGALVSQPYIEATLAMLAHHGVCIERHGRRFAIRGRQQFRGDGFTVPGDASSAAYLWAAAAVAGGKVRVTGIPNSWPQADLAVLRLLRSNGASVSRAPDGATVTAGPRRPFRVDLTQTPDLYPLAGILAATTPGVSQVVGAAHVVLKESDRKSETAYLARRIGARVGVTDRGLVITGTSRPRALDLRRLTDHRLVMSAAVAALAANAPSNVGARDAVRKSYPEFWDVFARLSGDYNGP